MQLTSTEPCLDNVEMSIIAGSHLICHHGSSDDIVEGAAAIIGDSWRQQQ